VRLHRELKLLDRLRAVTKATIMVARGHRILPAVAARFLVQLLHLEDA